MPRQESETSLITPMSLKSTCPNGRVVGSVDQRITFCSFKRVLSVAEMVIMHTRQKTLLSLVV